MIEKTTQTITPQFVPFKCPVCNGFGTVSFGRQLCKACKGEGYLKVPPQIDEEERGDPNELPS